MHLISLVLFMISFNAQAEFESCQMPRSKWIQNYKTQELDWIKKIESKKATPADLDWIELVYPQDLPDDNSMNGAYLMCFDAFEAFLENEENSKIELIECLKDHEREFKKPLLDRYLKCLKEIQD